MAKRGEPDIIGGMEIVGEGSPIYNILFPGSADNRLKMVAENSYEMVFPMAVLDMLTDRYNSKVGRSLGRQLRYNLIALERKGRNEIVEVSLSRRPLEGEED